MRNGISHRWKALNEFHPYMTEMGEGDVQYEQPARGDMDPQSSTTNSDGSNEGDVGAFIH